MGNDLLFNKHIAKAKEMYIQNKKMYFHYTEPIDRVYLAEIEDAMENKDVKEK